MRTLLTGSLFALAILVAACGGGGKSSILPNGGTSGGSTVPASTKTTNAVIVLKIPPPGQQVSRRPFYVSSGTQGLGVLVVPATSTETPTPTNLTMFPVATPSPCAAASGGGYTCTLNVTAPIGVDNFFVGAFATASPNANAVPLSEYIALNITVSASPAPNATPLTFTLDGVVYSVVISVPSPDPGNTPNTQVFAAGVAASPVPLGVTAYDASGAPILTNVTNTFADPIVIAASPAAEGITLSINGATCSSGGGATVSIDCAADLNHVQFAYNGTVTPDPNDHVVDTFTISTTTQQVNPTPSPAHVVLSSNMLTWQLGTGLSGIENAWLTLTSTGSFVYTATNGGSNYIGTFAPSTQTIGTMATLNGVDEIEGQSAIALDNTSGALWIADAGTIDCFSSVSSAIAGTAPVVAGMEPVTANNQEQLDVTAVAIDSAQNVWFTGVVAGDYGDTGDTYVGYFPATSGCSSSIPSPPQAPFFLNDDYDDFYPYVVAQSGGGIAYQADNSGQPALYLMTPSAVVSPPPVNATATSVLGGSAGGLAIDGAGTLYAAFNNSSQSDVETLALGGSALSQLLLVPPASSGSYPPPDPQFLSAFSPAGGAADRLVYSDEDYGAFGLIESVPASPMPILAPISGSNDIYQSAYSSKGGEYAVYTDLNGNLDLARVIPTTTWSVPATQFVSYCGGSTTGLLGIIERGDRGPFTVSYNATPESNQALPGADHDYYTEFASASNLSVQVQDAGGRIETYPISIYNDTGDCGLAHRPSLHRRPLLKPNFSRATRGRLGIRTP
jgi:hypothetical protein